MNFKPNEIKAGLMIFISLTIFIVFLVVIFGIDVGEETKEYTTYLRYVGGISKGSLVKYGGMDVGVVSEIKLPDQIQSAITVKIKINQKTPVRVDSKAYVTSVGIMADQHIEISAGSLDADLLPQGSVLESKEVLSFTQMAEPFGELNEQLQEFMERVVSIFNDENRAHLNSVLAGVDSMITNGQSRFVNVMRNLENLTANLAAMSKEVEELLAHNKENFSETISHLDSTTKETTLLIAEMRQTLSLLENMMTDNSTNIVEIMENFQYASQNLEEFTRIVKERPWLLVRKAAPPERKIP
ncbi:MAG: MlaD family protein [bacterium]